MKLKLIVMAMALFVGLVGVSGVQAANWVPYSGAWYSTDGNSNFLDLGVSKDPSAPITESFYLMNEFKETFLVLGPNASAKTVLFDKVQGKVWASIQGQEEKLYLGASGHFWFKYGDLETSKYWAVDAGHQYTLEFGDGSSVRIHGNDIAPVPIPGAALLLGSGLLVLLGVRKKYAA